MVCDSAMKTTTAEKQSPRRIPQLSANSPTSAAVHWQAIVNRDPRVNTFVYGVRTTRIYCRPSCPARLARRANVEFYDSPMQAQAAGYRACKRCSPELHVRVDPQVLAVQKACETISSARISGQKPKLQVLAAEAKLTPSHFHRVFKKIMGVTPGQYATNPGKSNRQVETRVCDPMSDENNDIVPSESGPDLDSLEHCLLGVMGHGTDRALGDHIDWNEFDLMMTAENEGLEFETGNYLFPTLIPPNVFEINDKITGIDLPLDDDPLLSSTNGPNEEPGRELVGYTSDAIDFLGPWEELGFFERLEDSTHQI